MAKKRSIKKSKPSQFFSILSVTLVLFLLGLVGLLMMNAHLVSTYFKENLQINVVLNDNAPEAKPKVFLKKNLAKVLKKYWVTIHCLPV